jgi:PAS domain S-box-containing protein
LQGALAVKQDRMGWVNRVIRGLDRVLESALVARRTENFAPSQLVEYEERELRVCRDTLRAAADAIEGLTAEVEQQALGCTELGEFVGFREARFSPASRERSRVGNVTAKRDRIDWLLTAINAVEDLVEPKLEARRRGRRDEAEPGHDDELEICLEELRVAAEELQGLRDRLLAERQRYVELFDFAPEPYLEIDARGNIREANRAAAELLGCSQEHLAGKPLALFVATEMRREVRSRMFALTEAAGGGVIEFDTRLQPRDERSLPVQLRACVARDAQGRLQGIRCLLRPRATPAGGFPDGPGESR